MQGTGLYDSDPADLVEGDEPEPVGIDAAEAAALLFRDVLRLPFPPLPRELVPSLRVLGPAILGTRTDAPGAYGLGWFLDEIAAGSAPDYLIFGHDGHGLKSWAMHYYLVQGPLALLVQIAWGGAYTDNDGAARRVARAFGLCEALVHAADNASLPPGSRLVAAESDFYGRRLGRVGAGKVELDHDPDPLATMLRSLSA